jgi:nucleoside-diphosphate-sugar epimerase
MRSRCVSLTGATGFLGQHIAQAFRAEGWRVRAIVRPGNAKAVPEAAEAREGELLDAAALARAFDGSDVVVHAAGLVRARSARQLDLVNVVGTRAVVDAANAVGARLVHVSSLAALGPGTPRRPVREADTPKPVNAYGRSKLAGEAMVQQHARVPWMILRPSAVYGPADRGFLPLVRLARRGLFPLAAPGAMPFTFVYAADVAEAVRQAAVSNESGLAVFIGHAQPETTEAMLRGMAAQMGTRYRPLPVPSMIVRALAAAGDLVWALGGTPLLDSSRYAEFRAEGFVCDVSAARERLGFTAAVPLSEGLARTVRWYRERGWV